MSSQLPQIFLDIQATQGGGATGLGSVASALASGLRVFLNDRFNFVPLGPSDGKALKSVFDRIIWEQLQLPADINRNSSNIINSAKAIAHSLCLGSPVRSNIRSIATVYDFIPLHDPSSFSSGFAGWYYRSYLPYCYRKANKLMCISEVVRQEAIEILKRKPSDVYLLPLFVRSELLTALAATSDQCQHCVIAVGTHEARKNFESVIKAYSRLNLDLQHQFPLILIGKQTSLTSRLKQLALQLNCADNVQFKNYVELSELAQYYKNARVNMFVSLFEGFGLPPLEALAGSCTSIISNIPVHKEVYGSFFNLVDPNNIEEISEQLEKCLVDSEYNISTIKKAATLLDKYTIEHAVAACSRVYYELIG